MKNAYISSNYDIANTGKWNFVREGKGKIGMNIRLDINGKPFGEVSIVRVGSYLLAKDDDEVEYEYDYVGALGEMWDGKIMHRPIDGATCLAVKTLNHIYDNRIRQ